MEVDGASGGVAAAEGGEDTGAWGGYGGKRVEGTVVEEGYEEGAVVPSRYSIPFFATANMDTVVEALPGCWGEGNPKKYEAVTAWGYVQERLAMLYE